MAFHQRLELTAPRRLELSVAIISELLDITGARNDEGSPLGSEQEMKGVAGQGCGEFPTNRSITVDYIF
jgi:hypothetical protein